MSRKLTTKEIEYILDFIKPEENIPTDTALSIVNHIKNKFKEQLKKQVVYPEIIEDLKKEIIKQYKSSKIQPGESVGVLCAQSIGEKQTQTTLNTFHKAGQSEKTMTSGVPRFQELINATKNPRIVNNIIYFNSGNKSIGEIRKTVGYSIVGLTLKDISNNTTINLNKEYEKWYDAYKILFSDEFTNHKNCITFEMNMAKLYEFKLSIQKVAEFIENEYNDLYCVFSPPEYAQLDVFVNTNNIKLPEERLLFINQENAVLIYLEECVQSTLEKIYICGIPGITEVFYAKKDDEWFIETNGYNSKIISNQYSSFKKLLSLPNIDYTRVISNNVWDIYEVLDIEAARQFLIEEFMDIMDGINPCHTMLLVDRMTYNGTISSISRYTLKADECGPMGKASFEETMDNFLTAGAQGQREPTRGVSASIICGKRANIGTGMFSVNINISKLPNTDIEIDEEDI